MVARFDYCCKQCGSNTFVAYGIAKDDPVRDRGDEVRSTLRFRCSKCSALAVELKARMDGRNELSQNLSTFHSPWDPKKHVPQDRLTQWRLAGRAKIARAPRDKCSGSQP